MIINVHTRTGGGAVLQFASRKDLRRLLEREPADDNRPVEAFIWFPSEPIWKPIRVNHLRKASIGLIVSAEDTARTADDLPAKVVADERMQKWLERTGGGENVTEGPSADVALQIAEPEAKR